MKKLALIFLISFCNAPSEAQLLDRLRNKAEQKIGEKIDQSIDKATQKKKPKGGGSPDVDNTPTQSSPQAPSDSSPENGSQKPDVASTSPQDISSYSKFDFVPGEKIIIHEDFAQGEIGDFPANWNTRSGAELVTVDSRKGKWLRLGQTGVFYPEYLTSDLPENFTLQLELLANQQVANIGQFMISIMQAKKVDDIFKWGEGMQLTEVPNFKLTFQPASSSKGDINYSTNLIGHQYKPGIPEFNVPDKPSVRIAIWRQNQRVRVYLDSTKILDLPRALDANAVLNSLVFSASNPDYSQKDGAFFIGDIQLAVGAPNMRNKLMNEGKFTTHGILFDVNSDVIKPGSYGTLRDIAQLLKENNTVRVRIVGHTDADGNDQSNLDLSRRRAQAVKQTLTSTFGIEGARLEDDGKGKAEPIDSNETAVGKANNRRVEFIKL